MKCLALFQVNAKAIKANPVDGKSTHTKTPTAHKPESGHWFQIINPNTNPKTPLRRTAIQPEAGRYEKHEIMFQTPSITKKSDSTSDRAASPYNGCDSTAIPASPVIAPIGDQLCIRRIGLFWFNRKVEPRRILANEQIGSRPKIG